VSELTSKSSLAQHVPTRAAHRAEDAGAQRNPDTYSMNTLRKFELWESSTGHDFFPAENDSARKLLDSDARLVKVFEAASWEEAQAMHHEFLGLEPYVPLK
jgi:hypothetical protein